MNIKSRASQSGAIFANLALGAAAIGSVAAVATDWTAQQSALALQKQQGYLFATLNDAVGNYMTVLYPQLTQQNSPGVDVIPAECANLPYRFGTSVATESVILQGKCKLTLPLSPAGSYVVVNAYQPTLADLKKLGLLDQGVSEVPVLTTENMVAGPDASGVASSKPAPNGYAIAITPKCLGMGSSATTCSNTNKALTSSVINIQPFVESAYIQNFMALMSAAGPDAALSGPPDASNVVEEKDRANPTGEFRSIQAGWTRSNPITKAWSYSTASGTSKYDRGVDNLVLMRNGYESAYWQLTRRDGSSPPTANWNFNGKDLTGVGSLTATSIKTSGDAQVGGDLKVDGNQTIKKNQVVEGDLTVGKISTFKDVVNALSNLIVSGSTELKGKLSVAGSASFMDNVTIDKALTVKGSTDIAGKLTGSNAEFTGALTANALTIGSTKIGKDGTLLGAALGWGVATNSSCSTQYALAQSADGKLQICRNNAWTSLITTENLVVSAPGVGSGCSPEGAPGRLPDGTLAVCKDGNWQSTAAGLMTEGATCSVEGSLATTTATPSPGLVLLGCKGGVWTTSVFSKPRLGYAREGNSCQTMDELAVDNVSGYYTLLICEGGTWRSPGTQLLENMELGKACRLNGVLASDMESTGLLVCKNNIWSKITDPIGEGGVCALEGKQTTSPSGSLLICTNGVWVVPKEGGVCIIGTRLSLPLRTRPNHEDLYCPTGKWAGALYLTRWDGTQVLLHSPVESNGRRYYVYNEPSYIATSPKYKPQNTYAVKFMLTDSQPESVSYNCNAFRWHRTSDTSGSPWNVDVCMPLREEIKNVMNDLSIRGEAGNGYPRVWEELGILNVWTHSQNGSEYDYSDANTHRWWYYMMNMIHLGLMPPGEYMPPLTTGALIFRVRTNEP
jgi:cytoskeletal protein CcmA (bactofilin family)